MEDYTLKKGDAVWVKNHKDDLWTARVLYSIGENNLYYVYDKFAPVSWNYCKPFKPSDAKVYKVNCRAKHMKTFLYMFSIIKGIENRQLRRAVAEQMYEAYEGSDVTAEFRKNVDEYYKERC